MPRFSTLLACCVLTLAGGHPPALGAEAGSNPLPERPKPSPAPKVAPLAPEKSLGTAQPKPGAPAAEAGPAPSVKQGQAAAAKPAEENAKPKEPAKPQQPAKKPDAPFAQASVPYGPPIPDEWPPDTVKSANALCTEALRGLKLEFEPVAPIRNGACGAPAPIKLKGMAADPPVEIRPAATMTCPMAAALDRWLVTVVQPRAKELLHAAVVRIHNVASYDCRHRNNDPLQRISFHAYAEAIDIAGFTTAKGERIDIFEHWPLDDPRGRFLKDIHQGACQIFGTVLGPEANEAHKNHFHFDLASRRKPLCDRYDGPQAAKPAQPATPVQTTGVPAKDEQPKKR